MKLTQSVRAALDALNKGGESYDGQGRHGWRNPIREDTPQLLYALALAKSPRLALEFGTAYGKSGLVLASGIRDGELFTIEFDKAVAKIAQETFTKALLPVKVFSGDALDVVDMFRFRKPQPKFDLVFLDAEKKTYLKCLLALQNHDLLNPNCLVIADNVTDRAEEMADFLDYMKSYPHTILPTECGLLVATV